MNHFKQIADRVIALVEDLATKLRRAKVPEPVIASILAVVAVGPSLQNPSAQAYARSMERAFDDYGVPGVTMQVAYFLINAGKWQGEDAKAHKAVLKKWSAKDHRASVILTEKAWTDNVETTWSPPEGFFKQSPDKIARGLKEKHPSLTSAMGSLNFYINRAGDKLDPAAKQRLHMAQDSLRELYKD